MDASDEAELRRVLLSSNDKTDNHVKNATQEAQQKDESYLMPRMLLICVLHIEIGHSSFFLLPQILASYPDFNGISIQSTIQLQQCTIYGIRISPLVTRLLPIMNTLRTSTGEIQPLKLTVGRMLPHGEMEMREYFVSQDDESVGPFDPRMTLWQKKHLFRSLHVVKFSFPLRDRQIGNFYEECFEWHVNVRFQVIESAQIHVQLEDCEVLRCASMHPRPFWATARQSFVWMHVVVAVFSLFMTRARKLLLDHVPKRNHDKNGCGPYDIASDDSNSDRSQRYANRRGFFKSWSQIPFTLKLQLLNSLQLLVLISLVLLLLSTMWSLLFLEAHMPIRFGHRLLHATALLLLWSCLVGYLEHNQHIYSIVLTLKWGTPRVLQFLLGVSPIFVGYALFGTIYFGNKIEEFGTLSASMITLFSLMNGDIIMDTFDAMELHHFTVSGSAYLYSFISLFMYVVLNIFIAIVEEAFFATQSSRRRLSDYRVKVAKESDISAEMMHTLFRLMDSE
ncbi:unnamed protein product [Peronospora effusa]|nr:unnamed protein product [Peronospora effusa]